METKRSKTTKHCAYGRCNSDSRYADRPEMKDVFFLCFPKPKSNFDKCVKWAKACSRVGFDESRVTKDTYICSLHFVGGKGPTPAHPDPIPANATKYDIKKFHKKPRSGAKRRLPLSPNDQNTEAGKAESQTSQVMDNDYEAAHILVSMRQNTSNVQVPLSQLQHIPGSQRGKENTDFLGDNDSYEPPVKRQCIVKLPDCFSEMFDDHGADRQLKRYREVGCQAETATSKEVSLRIQNKILETEVKSLTSKLDLAKCHQKSQQNQHEVKTESETSPRFDISYMKDDDKKCKFYTGLTFIQFMQLWNFLKPAVQHLKYWNRNSVNKKKCIVSQENALLMTLMRLRNGYTNQDLAYQFGVSISTVSNIILTWIQFLYQQFQPLKDAMFADRNRIREKMPPTFKKYKNIRCIIDCTEFFCQRPSNFARQGNLYSSYKSHCTYKVLVAAAPNGAIMFTSDVFEGSISDRDIVIKSGFLDFLSPGDTVMADRGFNIRDLLNERKVDLIIPPFLGGRKCLTPQEEAQTKDIAKHRIHVERSIERIKKFRLLQKIIPLSLQPVITQVVFVVGCLVNFQEPLVK